MSERPGSRATPDPEHLLRWREAYVNSSLPLPSRSDRWQVLRAGVAGLWEFEAAEYWYADGWVQLTGRNETGKSSLMALTTLIPWLGEVSPQNIDTLGAARTRGKSFRYYVEPTSTDGDRRDAEAAQNQGWLWVEYGRLSEDETPSYFTTLGYFQTKRATQSDFRKDWLTVHGSARVRDGLELLVGRAVQTPKDLAGTVPELQQHSTATAYREQVARRLLSAQAGDLEAVGKLLRIIRTPKLGQSLSEGWVTEQLRDSLPGLDPAEVTKLAAGWDELEKVRLEMDTTKAMVDALARYLRYTWRPYLGAELRQAADRAAGARTRLDEVTRTVRTATDAHDKACAELRDVTEKRAEQERDLTADQEAVVALRESSQYKDASQRVAQVRQVARDLDAATTRQQQSEADVRLKAGRTEVADAAAESASGHLREAASRYEEQQHKLIRTLDEAGLTGEQPTVAGQDWVRLDRLIRDRRSNLIHLNSLFATHEKEDQAARRAEDIATKAVDDADRARAEAEDAWAQAESERDSTADRLARWAATLPTEFPPAAELLDDLVAGLPRQADDTPPRLSDRLRQSWFEPHRQTADDRLRANESALNTARQQQAELDEEAEQLRLQADPVVAAPARLRRRDRPQPGVEGAPLWRLLDAPGVGARELAAIEAGLTAMGLLDAWVGPDGIYRTERDGVETVLVSGLPPAEGVSLADLLVHVGDVGKAAVEGLLAAIAWNGSGDYAVAADGNWHTPERAGRAELLSGQPELIGETTRQQARERRLAEIDTELVALAGHLGQLEERRSALQESRDRLDALLDQAPDDDGLRQQLVVAAERDRRHEQQRAAAEAATHHAETLRADANRSRATAFDFAADHHLPASTDDRGTLRDQLESADRQLISTGNGAVQVQQREENLTRALSDQAGRQQELEGARVMHAKHASEVTALRHSHRLLIEQLDANDSQILQQVQRLEEAMALRQTRLTALNEAWQRLVSSAAAADTELKLAESARSEREQERDAAYTSFTELIDAGLAADLDIALPQQDSRTTSAVRTQVATVRTEVTPRDWPSEDVRQADYVRDRRDRLRDTEGLKVLEAGGRAVSLRLQGRLPEMTVIVDASGTPYSVREAMRRLERVHADLKTAYDDTIRRNLEELLGSTFIDHLRGQLAIAYSLVKEINTVLGRHPTGTTRTVLRIDLKPVEGASGAVLETLRGSASLLDPVTSEKVREFLGTRIEDARQASLREGEVEWGSRLADALDYRHWWDVRLMKRAGEGGKWSAVNATSYALQSGGARVVMLMLPLVATLSALYRSMPTAPHPFWLDEAFDGLDPANRQMVLELLAEFDFDVLLAGPGRLLNSAAVPAGAIFQVVRADYPFPGADLTCELWSNGELTPLRVSEIVSQPDDPADMLEF